MTDRNSYDLKENVDYYVHDVLAIEKSTFGEVDFFCRICTFSLRFTIDQIEPKKFL